VLDDAEIFRRSVADPEVFEVIFERHHDALLRYCRQRVGHHVGEEIAARTLVIALERRATYDGRNPSARGWLYGIATNLIRHHLRDERVHLLALGRLPIDPDVADVADPDRLDAELERPALTEALADLSPGDREAFLLAVVADLTYPEIAAAMDIPIGTVRSRINRARTKLRERMTARAAISDTDGDDPDDPRGNDA
jgi:RNA polymerase sigma factor (sigma-70 family)